MAESDLNMRKKLQRRENTAKKRQATFIMISEYVFNKYFHIYQEAAQEFNRLNHIHPKKPDLRKSLEFKNWKRQLRGLSEIRPCQKRDPCTRIVYPAISIDQQRVPEGEKTMQLVIPLLHLPRNPEEIPASSNQVHDEVLDEGDTECSMSEKETAINNEQVPEEGNSSDEVPGIQPSLFEDISPDMMEEILEELRADPNLVTLMDDMETSFNEELDIGMNVEIDSLELEDIWW